jgi:hypothetical protein
VRPWTTWPALAASLVLLNASLTFANVWPTAKIRWESALSVELAAAVLLLTVAHRWAGGLARRVLPTLWVVLVFGHYLDVTAPGLYGREFNLYWDSPHLGNVWSMLIRDVPLWMTASAVTGFLLAVAAAGLAARLAWAQVASAVGHRGPRRALAALALVVIALFAASARAERMEAPVAFADPVSRAYVRQARYVVAMAGPNRVAPTLGASPDLDTPLTGLDGADVLLAFVESYGAVTYDNQAMAESLAPSRAELGAAIREAGREVVSAYADSPTFGGSSWLAHLSLLTGVDVRDQYAYVAVMASSRDTLPKAFARQGYRSIGLMPGMRQAWPEGAFYGFDFIYGRNDLDYQGPKFGWWSIPDQYTLAKFDAAELGRTPRAPVFAVFPTSTTHAPFGPVAPYQPDWSKLLGPDAFDAADVDRAMADTPDLANLSPSYEKALAYELATFAGYLREHAGDRMVMILIGDHQPLAAVSGKGAPHDVPVHVIASPGAVLDRLRAAGFKDGLEPRRPALGSMHALVPTLMAAFGR